jgi:hypothetical protein
MNRQLDAHDAKVLLIANAYATRGYLVRAGGLAEYGYQQPEMLGGHVPDVYAVERPGNGRAKPTHFLIEVDVEGNVDPEQLRAFRDWEENETSSFNRRFLYFLIKEPKK